MKPVSAYLLTVLLAAAATAQTPASTARPASRAIVEGIVIQDPGSEPVKKALIELIAEDQAEGGDYTAVTGADGIFHIENILPGRYRLFVERTGFLEVAKRRAHREGRVLTLLAGQELKDLRILVQAAAVVRGRVTDEDGDPMPNAQVSVLRPTFVGGRSRWEQTGSERTNDLGEYRVAGLPAGSYYVSVSPPPDFKSLIEAAGAAASAAGMANPDKPAATSYQTTYYPGTADRSQAAPIQLQPGDDFPLNFSLSPAPSLTIRGTLVNLPPRTSVVIMLQSHDFSSVLNGAEVHADGSFVIRDVAPGSYTILATVENTAVPMMARQSLLVLANSVEDVRLAPQPGAWVHGRLRLESRDNTAKLDPSQIFLLLRAADGEDDALGAFSVGDAFTNLAHVAADGNFEWKNVPPGRYAVQFAGDGGATGDLFVKSVTAGGRDVADSGISVSGGAVVVDLVASAAGALVDGVVTDGKGAPVPNGVIVAAPELRLRTRPDRYRKTVSDQSGHFTLRGIPPGAYTLLAWESVEGEAYYNPEFLKNYEGQGSALRIGEGERKKLQAIAAEEEQP
jgi:hypothetical protein